MLEVENKLLLYLQVVLRRIRRSISLQRWSTANTTKDASWWDLRKLNALKTLEMCTAAIRTACDCKGQFLAGCVSGGVVVSQYTKASKARSEPLRKVINAVDVKWSAT